MKNRIMKSEKGSGLVLALMVLLVLSVLGSALGIVTVGSHKLADINRDSTSAYYIAEAGANMAYEEIERHVMAAYINSENSISFFDKINTPFNNENTVTYSEFIAQSGEQPKARIELSGELQEKNTKTYTIKSTGEVGGKARSVEKSITVNWIPKDGNDIVSPIPNIPTGAVLIAKNKLNILNGTIDGNVYISSKNKKSIKLKEGQGGNNYTIFYPIAASYDEILDDSEIDSPVPTFVQKDSEVDWLTYDKLLNMKSQYVMPLQIETLPEREYTYSESNKYWLIETDGSVKLNNWMLHEYTIHLNTNLYIPTIDIGPEKKLTFNTGNDNYIIYVDNLKVLSGKLDVNGSGSLTIVVRDSTSFNPESLINQSGTSNQMKLVYTGQSPNFSEITSMNGHILSLGHSANITIKNSNINGIVITDAKKINFTGGNIPSNMMMIAPKGEIILGEGYKINGTLIGDTITTQGGGTIDFKEIDKKGFGNGSGSNKVGIPTKEELIKSEPAIEQ